VFRIRLLAEEFGVSHFFQLAFVTVRRSISSPFALVGYEVIITNSRYALVGYFITSYPTRALGIIVIYLRHIAVNRTDLLTFPLREQKCIAACGNLKSPLPDQTTYSHT